MKPKFRRRLTESERLIGTVLNIPSPETAELLALCGFDWLFVDAEHGAMDSVTVQRILQAVAGRTACAVRVPALDEAWFKKCLDSGADGIIVPHVCSADEAAAAVRWSRYPPAGSRSVGAGRAHGYGFLFRQYVESANDQVAVILQIEDIDAVSRIGDILGVAGVDALFVGPYDLSASMGLTGRVEDPQVVAAIERVRSAAAGLLPLGIFAAGPRLGRLYLRQGFSLLAVGTSPELLAGAAQDMIRALGS
jgi:2-dehydro-3-deoxyglucarate aldolase/4-hydroxy-2-oxoheptanedioate aldolase